MIIQINLKNRVIGIGYSEQTMTPNGVDVFKVKSIPKVGVHEILYFDPKTGVFYTDSIMLTPEQRNVEMNKRSAFLKKNECLTWLAENDWKVNKYTLGEWSSSDPRWIEYLTERKKIRAELDNANAILNS